MFDWLEPRIRFSSGSLLRRLGSFGGILGGAGLTVRELALLYSALGGYLAEYQRFATVYSCALSDEFIAATEE